MVKNLSIRTALVLLLTVQVVAVGGLTGWFSLRSGNQAVDAVAAMLGREVGDRVEHAVERFLDAPHLLNQLNAEAIQLGGLDPLGRPEALEPIFWHHIQHFDVALTYQGNASREYVGARRLSDGSLTLSLVNESTGFRNQRWATNNRGERTSVLKHSERVFDPTERPWYAAAVAADGPIWTPVYADFSSLVLGITAAQPVHSADGDVVAVLATDLLFDQIGAWLRTLKVGETGLVYLIEPSGELVSSSTQTPVLLGTADEPVRVLAEQSTHPVIAATARLLPEAVGSLADLRAPHELRAFVDGHEHYVHVQSFEQAHGLRWLVVVAVPRADFTAQLDANARRTFWLCLLAVVVAALVGGWLTRLITRPLEALSLQMDEISRFELESSTLHSSAFAEINVIQGSLVAMKQGLRSFEKYVPSELVRILLRERQEAVLGLKPASVTVYFSDVAGFTSITEALPGDQLVELMSEYLGEMSIGVLESRGTLDKYIGDAIMAFWNAPEPVAQHPLVAVRVALRNQRLLAAMRTDWEARGLPPLHQRIGLHTGDVFVGNFGSPRRMDYTVVGDVVNLASRLEGRCKGYGVEILVSEAVYLAVRDHILCRPVDRVAVKGREAATTVYEPLCTHDEATPEQRALVEAAGQAFARYLDRDFAGAIEALDGLTDTASTVLRERCKRFIASPPDHDWNGAFIAVDK